MNSVVLLLAAVAAFIVAYKVYGDFLAKKWGISNDNVSPATKFNDDKDYIPTNNVVVLGNQFSSIAGAGPITGLTLQRLKHVGFLYTFTSKYTRKHIRLMSFYKTFTTKDAIASISDSIRFVSKPVYIFSF